MTTTHHFGARRHREADGIAAALAVPCGLACAGSVIPGLDTIVTTVMLALAALVLIALGARWTARWLRERREDAADARTAARWRAAHARTCSPPPTARSSARPAPASSGSTARRWPDVERHRLDPAHLAAHHRPARPRRRRGLAVVPARLVHPRRHRRRTGRAVDHPPTRPRMVLPSLRHLVVDPMSPRTRNRLAAQGGLWGRQQHLPPGRGPGYTASNELELFVAVARSATHPGFVLIGPAERVFRRDPAHHGHVEPVPAYEAAMVAQMFDSRHLSTGGTHHVTYGRHDGPARAVLVPRATHDQIDRWTHLRPLLRPTGAAP
jgi:hypothetical protein